MEICFLIGVVADVHAHFRPFLVRSRSLQNNRSVTLLLLHVIYVFVSSCRLVSNLLLGLIIRYIQSAIHVACHGCRQFEVTFITIFASGFIPIDIIVRTLMLKIITSSPLNQDLDRPILSLKKHETPPSGLPLLFNFAGLLTKYSVCWLYAREAQLDKHNMSTAFPLFDYNYNEVPTIKVNNRTCV